MFGLCCAAAASPRARRGTLHLALVTFWRLSGWRLTGCHNFTVLQSPIQGCESYGGARSGALCLVPPIPSLFESGVCHIVFRACTPTEGSLTRWPQLRMQARLVRALGSHRNAKTESTILVL